MIPADEATTPYQMQLKRLFSNGNFKIPKISNEPMVIIRENEYYF